LINEAGIYQLIMRSNLPSAIDFQMWVCSDVLPAIRKHGMYLIGQENKSDEEISLLKSELEKAKKQKELFTIFHELSATKKELKATYTNLNKQKNELKQERNKFVKDSELYKEFNNKFLELQTLEKAKREEYRLLTKIRNTKTRY
jgi:prophage antirepressor-like protein